MNRWGKIRSVIIGLTLVHSALATTLHVNKQSSLQQAAAKALAGDTLLINNGIYLGNIQLINLQGSADKPITIMAATGDTVIFSGGNESWHLTDAAYLIIQNIIFEQQTVNGFNIDDGATYNTPSHHILFDNCTFRNINASGNNDLLKMSGVDYFEIRQCTFLNGATGGSGIDMVGCHHGTIINCRFENMGSNAVQAKGGSQYICIERNFFKHCGQRSINLGGSTGLPFFRPSDATFEAADLQVYANIIIGSDAPVAFVGCIRTDVVNNTLYMPRRWALRILQENTDTVRFARCGDNAFVNNIVYRGNNVSVDCNIGGKTRSQSFTFAGNLWYDFKPVGLPVEDNGNIVGIDPMFRNGQTEDFSISTHSPAAHKGSATALPRYDYAGRPFANLRSIGAYEVNN